MTNFKAYVTILCCGLAANVLTSQLLERCERKSDCPAGSSCVWRGCDGKLCLCDSSMLPTKANTACIKGTSLGNFCWSTTVCSGGPFSTCDVNNTNTCACKDGYRRADDMCIPRYYGNQTGMGYGQKCNGVDLKCVFDLVCTDGICECPANTRKASSIEMAAEPYKFFQCRPMDFKLGQEVNVNGPACQKYLTSKRTTPTTLSTSTTRPTTTTSTETSTSSTTSSTLPSTSAASTKPTSNTPKPTSQTSSPPSTSQSTPMAPSSTTTTTATSRPSPSTTSSTSAIPSTQSSPTSTTESQSISSKPSTHALPSASTITTTAVPTTSPTLTTSKSESIPPTTTTMVPASSSTGEPFSQSTTATSLPPSTEQYTTTSTKSSISTTPDYSTSSNVSATPTRTTSSPNETSSSSVPSKSTISTTHESSAVTKTPPEETTTAVIVTQPSSSSKQSSESPTSSQPTLSNTTVGLGDPCEHRRCEENTVCEVDSCGVTRCRCDLGYAESPDAMKCWKLSALGEICSGERLCQGANTQCSDDGVCMCKDEYERSDNGRWCRLKTRWFVHFPVVGEECSNGFFSKCYMHFEQECVDGRCRCKAGLRALSDKDKKAVYPDISQCRNMSYTDGGRSKMLCGNQEKTIGDYDVYDKAKSKIHRIQGAIIGGCVGFVTLLGILIGLIALVRWKKRGRRQTIRDTSSTASTDGQTSRYSFKIPRPFAHFLSSKEYDSSHISYPNTMFDQDFENDMHDDEARLEAKPDVVRVGTLARDDKTS